MIYKRLIEQHRECCALRGKGWGRKCRIADNKIIDVKMRKFDRNRDFDPYKCWELGCYNVG